MEEQPVSCEVFFSRTNSWLSRAIQRVMKCYWSHVGLIFLFPSGKVEYTEALFGKGVTAPRPLSDLLTWSSLPGNGVKPIPVNLPPEKVAKMWLLAKTYRRTVGYGELQLFCLWAFVRFGFRLPHTPNHVVCSELVARLLYPEIDCRPADRTFDEVLPRDVLAKLESLQPGSDNGI